MTANLTQTRTTLHRDMVAAIKTIFPFVTLNQDIPGKSYGVQFELKNNVTVSHDIVTLVDIVNNILASANDSYDTWCAVRRLVERLGVHNPMSELRGHLRYIRMK